MKFFIYRYHPSGIGIKPDINLSIICPEHLKNVYLEQSFLEENIFTLENFDFSELLTFLITEIAFLIFLHLMKD